MLTGDIPCNLKPLMHSIMNKKFPARILIIDNDEINSFIATKLIQRISPGTVVSSCVNGREALEFLKAAIRDAKDTFPEFIFLDLAMPVMDGWEFLDEFQKCCLNSAVRIIVLSSSLFRHDIDRAQNHAVSAQFISKPLTMEHLQNLFFKT